MHKSYTIISYENVIYFSPEDEDIFFAWIAKITCIKKVDGHNLLIDAHEISYNNLKNLIGLCSRYKIDMKQLAQFLTSENADWFKCKSAPWYRRIFREQPSKK